MQAGERGPRAGVVVEQLAFRARRQGAARGEINAVPNQIARNIVELVGNRFRRGGLRQPQPPIHIQQLHRTRRANPHIAGTIDSYT